MKITTDSEIVDLGLWLPKYKILALSDFHIGYESALNSRGIFIPRHQVKDTLARLKKLLSALKERPNKIIITGDLKHEFGTVSKEEFFGIREILGLLSKHCKELIILKGNHDKILSFVNKKIKIKKYLAIGELLFVHGDEIVELPRAAKVIVVGHSHPAIKLSDGITYEKVKCFLKGKWKGKTLIALPSFNPVTEGAGVFSERRISPYLESAANFEVWAVPKFGEVLHFGKISEPDLDINSLLV